MNANDMRKIDSMQSQGLGYKKIAAMTGLPVNSVKSYCRRHQPDQDAGCRFCGKPLVQKPGVKQKKFCDDSCRMNYWNSHREEIKHRSITSVTCPYCGTMFQSYGNVPRKFCSRACASAARRKDDV